MTRLVGGINGSGNVQRAARSITSYTLDTDAVLHQLALKLAGEGSGTLEQVQFDSLSMNTGKGSARVQGKLAWAPVLRADLKGTNAQLDPALFAADLAGSCAPRPVAPTAGIQGPPSPHQALRAWSPPLPLRGRGTADGGCAAGVLNGSFDTQTTVQNGQPDIVFTATIDKSQLRGYPLSLSAQGDTDTRSVRLKQFLLQSGKGSLAATGTVGWEPALRADLKAQLANFDPSQFVAGFKGLINGSIVTQTTQRAGKPDIAFAVSIDHSQLRGRKQSPERSRPMPTCVGADGDGAEAGC